MITKILIASRNKNKIEEIKSFLSGESFSVLTYEDVNDSLQVKETGKTFEDNAVIKARAGFERTGVTTLADDSGLQVDVLNGEPGVLSARFAGECASATENNIQLLKMMAGVEGNKRCARFVCVMALAAQDATHVFHGTVEGAIAKELSGSHGFGYDPLFIPDGYDRSFAELGSEVKSKISHRTRALKKVVDFLERSQQGIENTSG